MQVFSTTTEQLLFKIGHTLLNRCTQSTGQGNAIRDDVGSDQPAIKLRHFPESLNDRRVVRPSLVTLTAERLSVCLLICPAVVTGQGLVTDSMTDCSLTAAAGPSLARHVKHSRLCAVTQCN